MNGELLRGRDQVAGAFGTCGARPVSAGARFQISLSYFGGTLSKRDTKSPTRGETKLFYGPGPMARAGGGDAKAIVPFWTSARFLGPGLATVVYLINPVRVSLAEESTTGRDLIESTVRDSITELILTDSVSKSTKRISA